jgi:hypothetical protein
MTTENLKYSLPPLETLAALAATMASPSERPSDTARRATDLWQACAEQLEYLEPHYKTRRDALEAAADCRAEAKQFLANFPPGQAVPLESFLKACEPDSPGAKSNDRLTRWGEFVREAIAQENHIPGGKQRTPQQIEVEANREIALYLNDGMPYKMILHHWEQYVPFLARRKSKIRSAIGAKGGRPKKVCKKQK